MSPEHQRSAPPAPRIAGMVGWGLALGLLFVLWQRPALLTDLVRPTDHVADCDLATDPCAVPLPGGGSVTLAVSPDGLPAGEPLTWRIDPGETGITPVGLEITGQSMNMGLTRVALDPADGTWTGTGALPLCTSTRMDWRIDLRFLDAAGTEDLATFLTTTHRGADAGPATTAAAAPHGGADATPTDAPVTRSDFTVRSVDGDVALSDLHGKAVVLYFGYTACPDICPTTLASVGQAFSLLDEDELDRTAGLFVSLDPERDDVERLSRYAPYFHPAILGTTTDPERVAAIAADWGVAWRKVDLPGSALGYAVDHSTDAYLVGPDGRFLRTLPHGMPPDELAEAVRTALSDHAAAGTQPGPTTAAR